MIMAVFSLFFSLLLCVIHCAKCNRCSVIWVLEKHMAPHSSTLAWKIPWMEGPSRLQAMGSRGVGHNWVTSLSLSCIGEGNGNPLQCSCLENPRMEEPGGLPSMGSHRVRHDWSDLAAAAAFEFWINDSRIPTLKMRNWGF